MKLLDKIDKKWREWSGEGMKWPFVHDPVKGKPSVTLLFFYITFCLVTVVTGTSSTMLIIKGQYLQATFMPLMLWILGFVFYRLRRLDSVKINLEEKSLELGGNSDE